MTQFRSKKPVWLFLKLIEFFLSVGCCYMHYYCLTTQNLSHMFLLCGTYGGSSIICFLFVVGVFYAEKPAMRHEAAFSAFLGTMFLLTSFAQMHMATKGQFASKHWAGFYECCRDNSLIAFYAAAIFFIHCSFALDLMYSHRRGHFHPLRSQRPLRLYFLSPGVESYLSRFKWFRRISSQLLDSSHGSFSTFHRSSDEESDSDEELRERAPSVRRGTDRLYQREPSLTT
ncbi:uncharacterized protein [Drosophila bipectinata]|uniref:uncharacterized protein n=1 Tax=Drosophila bipectinata TaxID=42026 RepID=UPI001C89205C|nr:uncharacterized protein LOC108133087 [Drosophila bipectinata]